jgi:hypothetical protein
MGIHSEHLEQYQAKEILRMGALCSSLLWCRPGHPEALTHWRLTAILKSGLDASGDVDAR